MYPCVSVRMRVCVSLCIRVNVCVCSPVQLAIDQPARFSAELLETLSQFKDAARQRVRLLGGGVRAEDVAVEGGSGDSGAEGKAAPTSRASRKPKGA